MPESAMVLREGTILDGSGRPRFRADLSIEGDRIAAIYRGGAPRSARNLDCSGLIVAPGFIDTHSHSDLRVLIEPQLPMKLRQGVTLEVFGQDGISVAPVGAANRPQMETTLAGLLGNLGRDWDWESVSGYLGALERVRPAVDCAYLVPHGAVRLAVMGMEDRPAGAGELAAMQELCRQGMREGALGISTGLIYPPCCFAAFEELLSLGAAAAEFDGVFVAHIRSESDRIEDALAELIEVGRRTGVRIHISHFKIAGRANWPRIDALLDSIASARAEGIRVTADQYPYTAGSTMLGAILPPWAHAGGVEATLGRLTGAAERARLRAAILEPGRTDWDNFWKWSGPEGIVISDVPSGRHPEYVGKSVSRAAALGLGDASARPDEILDFVFDLLAGERMGAGMISFSQSEDVVCKILAQPYVNVCTDGLLGGRPHPRAYGTYPRVLSRYVRDLGLLSLEEAVRKMSGLAAESFRLPRHGRIVPGAAASLVAFDPDRILDRATFEDPAVFPEGIEYVIVNGVVAVDRGIQTNAAAGLVIRS